jgi:hypothetical protein
VFAPHHPASPTPSKHAMGDPGTSFLARTVRNDHFAPVNPPPAAGRAEPRRLLEAPEAPARTKVAGRILARSEGRQGVTLVT